MRAVQCRRVKDSVNSGDGRMHTYKPTAFSMPPDEGLPADGSIMPDLTKERTDNIRKKYEESGYHEACLLPGQDTFQCLELAPATLGTDDIFTAGRPSGEGLAPGGDTTRGSSDQSQYRSNKFDTDAGKDAAYRTLLRSRALLNTCHMPGVYADGTLVSTDIDACSVAALYGLQPQVFAASAAGRGYTNNSFAKCQQSAVPSIVEAYYRWKFPDRPSPQPGDMLLWWAKNRCPPSRPPPPATAAPRPRTLTGRYRFQAKLLPRISLCAARAVRLCGRGRKTVPEEGPGQAAGSRGQPLKDDAGCQQCYYQYGFRRKLHHAAVVLPRRQRQRHQRPVRHPVHHRNGPPRAHDRDPWARPVERNHCAVRRVKPKQQGLLQVCRQVVAPPTLSYPTLPFPRSPTLPFPFR